MPEPDAGEYPPFDPVAQHSYIIHLHSGSPLAPVSSTTNGIGTIEIQGMRRSSAAPG